MLSLKDLFDSTLISEMAPLAMAVLTEDPKAAD